MGTFLEQVAAAMLAEHGGALADVAVVLPSRRAGLHLRQALARQSGAALWSPDILTLPDLMARLSGLRVIPMEELLFEAYEAYRVVEGTRARPLEDFIEWAPVTLADMSEVDANLVGLDGFYRDLRSWEELEWSFNEDPLSEHQQHMVHYWARTGKLHAALNQRVLALGAGTTGLVERLAVERVPGAFTWQRIWFAGLNALTRAEEQVLIAAQEAGIARFAWDADRYYLDDAVQEAGDHLRQAVRRFGPGIIPVTDHLAAGGPRVQVMRASNAVAQVWCAADRLRAMGPEERATTAIVLADESLLPALLEALPGDTGEVNVTMGLSVASLPVGGLISGFVRGAVRADERGWLLADADGVLRHPMLRPARGGGSMDRALDTLFNTRAHRLEIGSISAILDSRDNEEAKHARVIFAPGAGTPMRTRLMALLAWAKRTVEADPFATEQVYQASLIVGRAADLLEKYGHDAAPTGWTTVLPRLLRSARIGFFGEPLTGLQIMGLLEARGLDPQRVILLGAQEGTLPAASLERSYIPFELRRAHGLPLRDSGDAVQAYNFLRLLQRSKEAVLVHVDDAGANGPSRFIAQLEHGLYKGRPGMMTVATARVPVPVRGAAAVMIPNDEETRARVRALLERGLSPSALGTWLRCPLDFWFRYVRGLKEPDVPGALIGADVMGSALHAVMEDLHRPWLGRPLDADTVEAAIPGIREAILARFAKDFSLDHLSQGQPLLQTGMAVQAVENYLRAEVRAVREGRRITPLALETELRTQGPLRDLIPGLDPVFKGRLDRMDDRDGVIHILDLKTGGADAKDLELKELNLDALRGKKGHAAQLLMYAWIHLLNNPDVAEVRAGLQTLRSAGASDGIYLKLGTMDRITRTDLPAITALFADAVRALLDPEAGYAHDPDNTYCVFCAKE